MAFFVFAIPSSQTHFAKTERNAIINTLGVEPTESIYFINNISSFEQKYANSSDSSAFLLPETNEIYISALFAPNILIGLPHELFHSAYQKIDCPEFAGFSPIFYEEKLADTWSYFRHPGIYKFQRAPFPLPSERRNVILRYTAITRQLESPICLEEFFSNFKKNCQIGNVKNSLQKICGVTLL